VLLLVVWIAVGVVAVVVLGTIAHGLVGSFRRLGREVDALDRELRPVLAEAQAARARAAQAAERRPGTA
jgi:hypothetical protein